MPFRARTMVNFRAEEHRITPEPTKAIRIQFHGPGKPRGRRVFCHIYMHCVLLHALRRAAIFNSKVCQLCKARHTSCDTSEWESPEGTAAFYSRLAHQLSTFKKPPSPASPGTWQRFACGLGYAFHYGCPRAQHSAGRYPTQGRWMGFACT